MSQLAERYAVALFELAEENDKVISWQEQTKLIRQSLTRDMDSFFSSYVISSEEKKEVLTQAFSTRVDSMVMNFLYLLIDKGRFSCVVDILISFNTLCNNKRKIKEGILYTARLFSKEQISEIEKVVSKKMGAQCELMNKIDQRLISGFKVMIENEVIDSSMKSNIESLKRELLKETR